MEEGRYNSRHELTSTLDAMSGRPQPSTALTPWWEPPYPLGPIHASGEGMIRLVLKAVQSR